MQTPAPRNRARLRVEELHSRTLPAVLDPAAAAVMGDDAQVSTTDDSGVELAIDETLVADDGTAELDIVFRCGTVADPVAEDAAPIEQETILTDGDVIPDQEYVSLNEIMLWIPIADDGTGGDPATTDELLMTTDEDVATDYDPTIYYFADFPPEPAEGDGTEMEFGPAICYFADMPPEPATGDAGSSADVALTLAFGAPVPTDLSGIDQTTNQIDPTLSTDDTTGEPPMTEAPIPTRSNSGQQGFAPAASPASAADASQGIDDDGMGLPLGDLAGNNQ